MTELYEEIINDLKRDFPDIESITYENNEIIIIADDELLWDIFEILYNNIEDVEFNLDKNEKSQISIKV